MKPKGYLNKQGAADYLGVARRTIDNLMKRKQIAYYKVQRSVLFKEQDLAANIEACKVEPKSNHYPPTAHGSEMDVLKKWTFVCQWLRLIQNGGNEKHAMLAKDCLAHIAKFVE